MTKNCQIILKNGPNKGKRCFEVNKYCTNPQHIMNFKCQYCQSKFSHRTNVIRHEKNHCKNKTKNTNQEDSNNKNIIQIKIGNNDNFLNILSKQLGPDLAQEYILGCARNDEQGDLNLLNKVYGPGNLGNSKINITDSSLGIQFIDSDDEVEISEDELFRRITNNVQACYLTLVDRIIAQNPQLLNTYDIMMAQQHLFKLTDKKYQSKIIQLFKQNLQIYNKS